MVEEEGKIKSKININMLEEEQEGDVCFFFYFLL